MPQISTSRLSQRKVLHRSVSPQPPVDDEPRSRGTTSLWGWLKRSAPTVAVMGALGGLAVWGHSTEWTMPKFSSFFGVVGASEGEWCKEHNVPEEICIECHADLLPPDTDYGWCKEHGISQCPLHHPELAQVKTTPAITANDLARARRALALRPRAENNSRCNLHRRRIQFASTEAIAKAGVDIAVVAQRPITEAVAATGEVIYDQTRMAHLASRVPGTVARVFVEVGSQVHQGDVLALVDSAEIGKAKAELLQAITQYRLKNTNLDRLTPLVTNGSIPEKQFRQAEADLNEAEIRLLSARQYLVNLDLPVEFADFGNLGATEIAERIQFLGLPTDLAADLDPRSSSSNYFPLRAPFDGVVVSRQIVPGEVVGASATLLGVADVRQMWLMLDVRQDEAKYMSLGQPVLFRPGDSTDEPDIKGSLAWISTEADDQTRTVKVRVNLPNVDGQLRANIFGTGRIVLREEPKAIVVPSEAVHWDGTCNVVFVRDKHFFDEGAVKFFHIRPVRLGVKDVDLTEIIAGVLPGEVIASKNSVVLEAQLLKSNLGAGCGCADGH